MAVVVTSRVIMHYLKVYEDNNDLEQKEEVLC